MLLSMSTPVWRRYDRLILVIPSSARLLLLLRGVVRFTGTEWIRVLALLALAYWFFLKFAIAPGFSGD